jgi:hypothetical protein
VSLSKRANSRGAEIRCKCLLRVDICHPRSPQIAAQLILSEMSDVQWPFAQIGLSPPVLRSEIRFGRSQDGASK